MSEANPAPNAPSTTAAKPGQKAMTKAERRELQERQRAAKAANPGAKSAKPPKPQQQGPSSQPSTPRPGASSAQGAPAAKKDPAPPPAAAVADAMRGLRIFSHFGLPKYAGTLRSNLMTREIHPAILRLGLQFAEFKITGANARCLATLQALKTARLVRMYKLSFMLNNAYRSSRTTRRRKTRQ